MRGPKKVVVVLEVMPGERILPDQRDNLSYNATVLYDLLAHTLREADRYNDYEFRVIDLWRVDQEPPRSHLRDRASGGTQRK